MKLINNSFKSMALAGILAGAFCVFPALAQSPAAPARNARPGTRMKTANRARLYYNLVWGVDNLVVRTAESGEIIRFSYRVLDAEKAKPLNNKKFEPQLIDPKAGVKLSIPSLEKVGQLRQSSTPETGKSYWMAFSNKRRFVKPGDHVNIVIGQFRADGLVVE
jgi:hypothetical protein